MSYCRNCLELREKEHDTPYGLWSHECKLLGIGRLPDTHSCAKIKPIEMLNKEA